MDVSVKVLPDRSVSFTLENDSARSVIVAGEFTKLPIPLKRRSDGLWHCQTKSLSPEIYAYNFNVDGTNIINNSHPKEAIRIVESLLIVPGEQPMFYDKQNVPHGSIEIHNYSSVFDENRRICIYNPPNSSANKSYPVLFLCHGAGDTELTWEAVGRIHFILDNLISKGKIEKLIAVMPFGHIHHGTSISHSTESELECFEKDIIEAVIPFIKKHYSVKDPDNNWAIAGVSMGGFQALNLGLRHSDIFKHVGVFSGYPGPEFTVSLEKYLAGNKHLNIWLGCGQDDYLLRETNHLIHLLNSHDITHSSHLTAGFHSWIIWRKYLLDFVQTIFNKN